MYVLFFRYVFDLLYYAFIYLTYKIKNYLPTVKRILQSIVLYTSLIDLISFYVMEYVD